MKKISFRVLSNKLSGREEAKTLLSSLAVALTIFVGFPAYYTLADTAPAVLTVTVNQTMSFSVTTDNFPGGGLTPLTPQYATSTLSMSTTGNLGYNVILSCDGATSSGCLIHSDTLTQIPSKTQWSVGAGATSTLTGNATQITSGDTYLAFRGLTASSTHYLFPTGWWGTTDVPSLDTATTKWAGIASSTNASRIGNTSWYNGGTDLNTVRYYVNVGTTQKGGTYTANLTYTGTAN